ncbi:MAG TPA: LysR family transcriptional regulator [Rhizomicrobium sp.]|nr:LysR family transcriptional regulator [Rhizomicrobium sp.]
MIDRLDDLKLFALIVERGSLTAAAREIGLSQGAVSVRLAALENALSTQLLRRTTRRLQLTEAGDQFYQTARRVLSEIDDLEQSLAGDRGELKGPIRVTAPWDIGRNHLAPSINDFINANPGLTISLMLSDATLDLNEYGVDLAIRYGRLPDSSLQLRRISTNRRLPVASPTYLDRVGRPAKPQDLLARNCISLLRDVGRFDLWPFVVNGIPSQLKVSGDRDANDGDLLRRWAIEGKGIILKSAWDVALDIERGLLEPLLLEYCPVDVDLQIVLPAARSRPKRVSVLCDHLVATLRAVDKRLEGIGLKSEQA